MARDAKNTPRVDDPGESHHRLDRTSTSPHPPPPLDGVENALTLDEALRLERNVALLAGAGTGKTYSLVTMCLHVLAGAREGQAPLPPSRLGLLTFTDKAASEMRARLRRRLERLALGSASEPQLEASLTRLGRPLPPTRFWRKVLDELGAASIGTFHSLCTQLLRRAPPGAEVTPHFELLDERDARALLRRVVERVLLHRVTEGVPELVELVRDLGFGGRLDEGLVDSLAAVAARLRDEGLAARYVRVEGVDEARATFEALLDQARREAHQASLTADRITKSGESVRTLNGLLSQTTFDNFPKVEPLLGSLKFGKDEHRHLGRFIRSTPTFPSTEVLSASYSAYRMAPHEAAVRTLLEEVETAHSAELSRRGVLDFTGLLTSARRLLLEVPEARREAQARFGALLVDEFQDTNRLQLDLVLLLSEARAGAPRPISQSLEPRAAQELLELPIEPAFVAVVGDRKQAIYEFRGADVSVFEVMAARLVRGGGGRAFLQASHRSSPALVQALNALMGRVLGAERYQGARHPFEVAWDEPADALTAVRPTSTTGAPLVRLVRQAPAAAAASPQPPSNEDLRTADADGIARYLAWLLSSGVPCVTAAEGGARAARGGDVALLFQRFTNLEVYRQALVRHGVRHRVVRGRGFFGAQEVVDVASLLALVGDSADAVSLAAVLRSPLVCLRDASLVRLALATDGLDAAAVLRGDVSEEGLSELERRRLGRLRDVVHTLRRERDRLGVRALVRVGLDALDARVLYAAGPFGEQALANLDKLVELAGQHEQEGATAASFARELLELAELEPTEAQGEVVDALDAEVVTLCTVHQAKGLEWPVVVLPELFARPRSERDAVRFDRSVGLVLRPLAMDDEEVKAARRHTEVKEVSRRRARAESLRLLYVALTRARDRLVLGLMQPGAETWAAILDGTWWSDLAASTERVDPSSLEPGQPVPSVAAAPTSTAAEVVQAVRSLPAPQAQRAVLPVTQLQDFVTCPRRFHYLHQVGLAEHAGGSGWSDEPFDDADETPRLERKARGTAVHRLLELTPLGEVGTARLPAVLEALQRSEGLVDDAEGTVKRCVSSFWASALGRQVASLGDERARRELPFMLRLTGADGFCLHLRGQIDLVVDLGAEALVIDYKTSTVPAGGLSQYRFQLACYALAARALLGRDVPVRAGIVFLREPDVSPHFLEGLPGPAELEAQLAAEARDLTVAQVRSVWPGRVQSFCNALECGYVYRCHPRDGGL